jgi:hypothetical protein
VIDQYPNTKKVATWLVGRSAYYSSLYLHLCSSSFLSGLLHGL